MLICDIGNAHPHVWNVLTLFAMPFLVLLIHFIFDSIGQDQSKTLDKQRSTDNCPNPATFDSRDGKGLPANKGDERVESNKEP